ncbi:hypothetical protein PASE110613_14390 [Paenibacillus sediminis]|uniref:5-methylcytosine-specific restriction endonuclease McrBC regulatory subunit McrC n=1 Tax=Paenibacillus sediminis TaxID=664909 RepID=A0ABS4H7M1_9BACL|nr:hypothetical protein [Paenibacillus sediminis]MBP1938525.1 5-methylcytosine-specific restriction endonuclease McrBC regulatory subunit McrC [Paenibacillus sediminis]
MKSKRISLSYRDETFLQQINKDRERWLRVTPNGKEVYEPLFNEITRNDSRTCTIEPGPYVGLLSLNDCTISFLPPKWLPGFESKHIHYMLYKSNPFAPKTTHLPESISEQTVSSEGFFEPLYSIFANELLASLSKGIYRTYIKEAVDSKKLKGSLNFSRQLLMELKGKPLFATELNNFSNVNEINTLFYIACKIVELHTTNNNTAMLIEQAKMLLPKQLVSIKNLNTLQLDRRGNHLQWALQLAKLIANKDSFSFRGETSQLFSLLINLFDLFENYVSSELYTRNPNFSHGFEINLVDGSSSFIANSSWDQRRVFPDIVYNDGQKKMVLDTKFKKVTAFGPDISDVYQLFFYASMLNIDRGVIIYPSHKDTADIKEFPISFNSKSVKYIVCYGLPIVGTEAQLTEAIDKLYDYLKAI